MKRLKLCARPGCKNEKPSGSGFRVCKFHATICACGERTKAPGETQCRPCHRIAVNASRARIAEMDAERAARRSA